MDKKIKNNKSQVSLGSIERIGLGHALSFVVDQEEIAVYRSRDGKVYAISNQCPHRQGPLSEGIFGDGKVICPLHGHKFDLTTGQGSEGGECIKTFQVWEDQGQLMMEYKGKEVYESTQSRTCAPDIWRVRGNIE